VNAAIVDDGNVIPFTLFEIEFKPAVIPVRIVDHEKGAELVFLGQPEEIVSDNGADGVNFTVLGIQIMAQNVIFCPVIKIGIRSLVDGEYPGYKVLLTGFSPDSIFGQRTEPRTWNGSPWFGIQGIPDRTEASFADHVDFKTDEFWNWKIFEERNFEESRLGNPAMRKELRNNGLRVNVKMQRNDILQDILDAVDFGGWRSEDMIFRTWIVVFQRKDERGQMGQMPVVAHECKMNGFVGCHVVNLLLQPTIASFLQKTRPDCMKELEKRGSRT
jgi:hypothetical protein